MNKSKTTIPDLLYQCGLRINNSINDPAVSSAVAMYGYTQEELLKGKTLLDESQNLAQVFDKEQGDVSAAYSERDEKQEKANATYMRFFNVGKVAFKNNPAALVALQMTGRRAVRISKWFTQTKSFYNNLLSNPQWLQAIAKFGIT